MDYRQQELFCNVAARGAVLQDERSAGTVPQGDGPGRAHMRQAPFVFYATFDVDSLCSYIPAETAILLPASSWARKGLSKPRIPTGIWDRGADSGGFVASFSHHGEYTYTLEQYVAWNRTWSPLWAATMDLCCEHELGVHTRERQERTTANAWQAWDTYQGESWVWVPTIQGRLPQDYQRHTYELLPLIRKMHAFYRDNPHWRVGIGTLCRRNDVAMVQTIVDTVCSLLPASIRVHLWGIKLDALRSLNLRGRDFSVDSAVWHGAMYASDEIAAAAAQRGMSRREYKVKVNLPEYVAKVHAAVEEAQQVFLMQQDRPLYEEVRQVLRKHGGWTLDLPVRRNRCYAYAVRGHGKRRERWYLCPVTELRNWLASFSPAVFLASRPAPSLEEQLSPIWQREEPPSPLAGGLENKGNGRVFVDEIS